MAQDAPLRPENGPQSEWGEFRFAELTLQGRHPDNLQPAGKGFHLWHNQYE
ncbi:MAG: hypothetical protein MUC60_06970 [Oscillatoria sp. Prado101]|jgi:hypothetical protein|nr:hypothetical protein [Oscillatoria sp. Prado101]